MSSKFQQRCREHVDAYMNRWEAKGPTKDSLEMVLRLHCVAYYSDSIEHTFHHLLMKFRGM